MDNVIQRHVPCPYRSLSFGLPDDPFVLKRKFDFGHKHRLAFEINRAAALSNLQQISSQEKFGRLSLGKAD
jgi:hypothetical protein